MARRRQELKISEYVDSYDREHPSHLIYPSAEFEKDAYDNLRMRIFNGVVALTIISTLQKRETKYGSEYFVSRKKGK